MLAAKWSFQNVAESMCLSISKPELPLRSPAELKTSSSLLQDARGHPG